MKNTKLKIFYNNHCKKKHKECLKLLTNNIFFLLLAIFISSCAKKECPCNDDYAVREKVEQKYIPLNTVPERPEIPDLEDN